PEMSRTVPKIVPVISWAEKRTVAASASTKIVDTPRTILLRILHLHLRRACPTRSARPQPPLDPNSPADATPACKACQEKVSGIPVVCQKRNGQDQAAVRGVSGRHVLEHHPALHHEDHVAHGSDVLQRIAPYGDEISGVAGGNRSDLVA